MREDTELKNMMAGLVPWTTGEKLFTAGALAVVALCLLGLWKLAEVI